MKQMERWWRGGVRTGLLLLAAVAPSVAGIEVEELFLEPRVGWLTAGDGFPPEWVAAQCFYWTDDQFRQLRYYYAETAEELTVAGIPVAEGEFFLNQGRLARIELVLYSIDEEFNAGLTAAAVEGYLAQYSGAEPFDRQELILDQCVFRTVSWRWYAGQASLVWAVRGTELAYLKLVITPELVDWAATLAVPPRDFRVSALPGILKVPAVRQGNRQYCAAAAIERVMRYFGSSLDQHLAAALIGVDVDGGAQMPEVMAALNRLTAQLRVRAKMLYVNADYESYEAILAFFIRYNRWAVQMEQPEFNTRRIRRVSGERGRELLTRGLGTLNRKVLKKMRCGNEVGLNLFRTRIIHYLRRGIPLIWTTLANGGDSQVGFHMMIINGFDVENDLVIYRDSADDGNRALRMPLHDAWSITNHLAVIIPAGETTEAELPESAAAFPPVMQ